MDTDGSGGARPETLRGALLEGLPFSKALGMRVESAAGGRATLSIPYDAKLVGDPASGVIHGGAVTALLDTCCGVAAVTTPSKPLGAVTLDLRIDYMRPATPGESVWADAEVYRENGLVFFLRAVAHQGDANAPVAMATGVFMGS